MTSSWSFILQWYTYFVGTGVRKKYFEILHSFGGEVKPSVPCRRFAACERSLNLCGSRNLGKITFSPTVPPFAARISRVVADGGTWRLKWERLKTGESNGKLPPRTCPGCSMPELYRSHDWALVPAKPGLQGWIVMNEWITKKCMYSVFEYKLQNCSPN